VTVPVAPSRVVEVLEKGHIARPIWHAMQRVMCEYGSKLLRKPGGLWSRTSNWWPAEKAECFWETSFRLKRGDGRALGAIQDALAAAKIGDVKG